MTSAQQRSALQRQIWVIANDVRGIVDGWDFKHYVLGTLFYRFISENFASYIEAQLNAELKTTVARIDQLRADIDAIVAEIEGNETNFSYIKW